MDCLECHKPILKHSRASRAWQLHPKCVLPATIRVGRELDVEDSQDPVKIKEAIKFFDDHPGEVNSYIGILVEFARSFQ